MSERAGAIEENVNSYLFICMCVCICACVCSAAIEAQMDWAGRTRWLFHRLLLWAGHRDVGLLLYVLTGKEKKEKGRLLVELFPHSH